MTGWDAAEAVLSHIADNADIINANPHLAAAGFALSLEAEDADGSTDEYKFLKLDEREIMPNGLNIFVTFGGDTVERRYTGKLTHKRVTIYVLAYFAGATTEDGIGLVDPAKMVSAKRGISEAMAKVLNRGDVTCEMPAGEGKFYDAHITSSNYAMVPKPSMGEFVPGVQFTYEGIYAVQATDTDGAAPG